MLAVENYFVVRADTEHCSDAAWSDQERDAMGEARWWSAMELENCLEVIYPPDLSRLFDEGLDIGAG